MSYHERPNLPGFFSYDGRTVQADVETHRFAVGYVSRNFPAGTLVLDLAAGQGALSKALLDAGYHVTCTSWNDKVDLPIETFKLNLDLPFSPGNVGQRRYPLICGIEIIEHVENPALFLRSCRNVLEDNGRLILSTPNVQSAQARLQWLIRGCPAIFSGEEVRNNRHISMMWREGIEFQIKGAGFDISEKHLLGQFQLRTFLQRAIKGPLYWMMKALLPGDISGNTVLYVLSAAKRESFQLGPENVY